MYKNPNFDNFWMPFTNNKYFKSHPKLISTAKGKYFYDTNQRPILDGTSGLWCCQLGHQRPEISQAVTEQLNTLDYSPPFQLGHPYSFEFSERLAKHLPGDINKIFFTNSGSESVDTALKIALAYQRVRGKAEKIRLIGREKAYHGTNIGGTSLGGMVNNRRFFGPLLPGVDHICHTLNLEHNAFQKGQPEWGGHLADDLLRKIDLHGGETIAAVMVEPVAGSVGIYPPPKGYLERLRQICDDHDILLIFDEVITGFGRLGSWFAAHHFNVTPDIMTLAKGITNGTIPMGAVCVKEHIYQTFIDNVQQGIELFHGYTYSGHPVSCAAGLATLKVYEQDNLFDNVTTLAKILEEAVFTLKDCPRVVDIRTMGLMAGIQLTPGDTQPDFYAKKVFESCYEQGVMVRFNGPTLEIAPPLICDQTDISQIIEALRKGLALN